MDRDQKRGRKRPKVAWFGGVQIVEWLEKNGGHFVDGGSDVHVFFEGLNRE